MPALAGVCRAERVMWGLTPGGDRYIFALIWSRKRKFRLKACVLSLKPIRTCFGPLGVARDAYPTRLGGECGSEPGMLPG